MTTTQTFGTPLGPRLGAAGELIDRFRLLALVGAGGFGEVWRAQEELEGRAIGQACAVKIMSLPSRVNAPGASEQMQGWAEEVRALRAVECPAIPRTYWADHLRERQLAYIAMELLDGRTLAERIKRGPIAWRRALSIASGIAGALDAAQALSPPLVHCDLKPQNVFLTTTGRVCVIDWGIAKLQGAMPSLPSVRLIQPSPEGGCTLSLTAGELSPENGHGPVSIRTAAGTPGYVAPEVYGGEDATPAADRYALGVVLYQMITGRLPYWFTRNVQGEGSTNAPAKYREALLAATMQGDIEPLDRAVPSLPPGVAMFVEKLLSREPEARGAGSLVDEIAHVSRFPYGVPDPPYAGLEAFDVTRASLLFGRRPHVDAIVERLKTERALLLRGPSGCGKSSLAIAGVAARLDELMFNGTDGWTTIVVRASRLRGRILPDSCTAEARSEDETCSSTVGTLVIVDQLEELLRLPESEQRPVVEALRTLACGHARGRIAGRMVDGQDTVRVLATVRDDLEWQILRIEGLREAFDAHREYVVGIDAGAAREIVEAPAKAAGARIEDVAVVEDEVREELARQATMLPLVQFALTEWWHRRDPSGLLTTRAWREIGGVQGALTSVADRFHDALGTDEQAALRTLFQRLFRGDRKVPLRDGPENVIIQGMFDARWTSLLTRLVDHRLVRSYHRDDGSRWFEATHEALARQWPLLQTWLSETAAEDALIDELELAAKLWRKQGSPRRVELPSHTLAKAEELAVRLDQLTVEYVAAAAAHARELKLSEDEREKERAHEAQRRRNSRRITAGAFATVLGVALAGYIAMSRIEQTRTEHALKREESARTEADRQREIAVAARSAAQEAADIATRAEQKATIEREKYKQDLEALTARVDEAIRTRSLAELRKARERIVDTDPPKAWGGKADSCTCDPGDPLCGCIP